MTSTFKHQGKTWTLFKAQKTRDASWRIKVRVPGTGQRVIRSLDTNQADIAAERARLVIDQVKGAKWEGKLASDSPRLCLQKLKDAFLMIPLPSSSQTRQRCLYYLDRVLSYGPKTLSRDTIKAFFDAYQAKASQLPQSEASSVMVTANSMAGQAMCVFSPRAIECYRDLGLAVPDMGPIREAVAGRRFYGIQTDYDAPSDELVQKTINSASELSESARLALGLMLAFGLRKAEAAKAEWNWIKNLDGYVVIDGQTDVKNGTGRLFTRALDPYWTMFLKGKAKEGYVIIGNRRLRSEGVFEEIGRWMRKHGWQTVKSNHALRALYGGLVAMRFGIEEASRRLRHNQLTTTQRFYSHFLDMRKLAKPEEMGIEWAKWE